MSNLERIDNHLDCLIMDLARAGHTVIEADSKEALIALHGLLVDIAGAVSLLRDEVAALRGVPPRVWNTEEPSASA